MQTSPPSSVAESPLTPPSSSTENSPSKQPTQNSIKSLEAVRAIVERGEYRQARTQLQAILTETPNSALALLLLARCESKLGNLDIAVDVISSIPIDHPGIGLPATGQASEWLIELKRYSEAEEKLQRVIEKQPDLVAANRRMAQLMNNQGRRFEAIPYLQKLAQTGAASLSELYGMHVASNPFIHRSPDRSLDVDLNELANARLLWFDGKIEQTRVRLNRLLESPTKSLAALAFAGRVFAIMQDENALVSWRQSLPPNIQREPEYWFAMGTWQQLLAQHRRAVRCFAEAVSRDPTDRFSYLGLSQSLAALGEEDSSRSAKHRFEQLESAEFIVSEIDRSPEQLQRLIELLIDLKRPAEAQQWARVTKTNITTRKNTIPAVSNSPLWQTCGVRIADWPLPEVSGNSVLLSTKSRLANGQDSPRSPLVLQDASKALGLSFQYLTDSSVPEAGVADPSAPSPSAPSPGVNVEQLSMYQIGGGGMGAIDFDLDGWTDIYFGQGSGVPFQQTGSQPNELFRNLAGQRFESTEQSSGTGDRGYTQGIAVVDENQDGFHDLVVANIGKNSLYRNNGDGTFTAQNLGDSEQAIWTSSIAGGDINGDHLPDLVFVNYLHDERITTFPCRGAASPCTPQKFTPAIDQWLPNNARGSWDEHPQPMTGSAQYGLGIVMADFDNTPGNELYIANDTVANQLWCQQQSAERTDHAQLRGLAVGLRGNPKGSMGIASGDYDRDGRLDVHVTNFSNESSDLYLQRQPNLFFNTFSNDSLGTSTVQMVGWGTQAADFDNDGWLDLAALNGHFYNGLPDGSAYRMKPQLFSGSEEGLALQSEMDGFWQTPTLGRSLLKLDWNRDGRMDLLANHLDAPASLLNNESLSKNWVQFELIGVESERDAIGARVVVECDEQQWSAWVTSGDGYQCSNQRLVHIGIGDQSQIDHVHVFWPSGQTQTFSSVPTNQQHQLIESQMQLSE